MQDEVVVSEERLRLDYLLVGQADTANGLVAGEGDEPVTLRRLWPMLPRVSVVEYKSPTHPYRAGELDRLWGYVHTYFANQVAPLGRRRHTSVVEHDVRQSLPSDVRQSLPSDVRQSLPSDVRQSLPSDVRQSFPRSGAGSEPPLPEVRARRDVAAVLVVSNRTPSLDGDIESMGLTWEDCGGGYWRVRGGLFALFVVELDVAGPADGDELLYSLGHGKPTTAAARRFWMELVGSKEAGMSAQEMEGFDELMQKFLDSLSPEQRLAGLPPEQRLAGLAPEQRLAGLAPEQRLAGLPPEQRLAGLPPEQRLADLDRDHQALALPLDVLRLLPEEYLASLSPEVQAELRRRLGRNGH